MAELYVSGADAFGGADAAGKLDALLREAGTRPTIMVPGHKCDIGAAHRRRLSTTSMRCVRLRHRPDWTSGMRWRPSPRFYRSSTPLKTAAHS